MTVQKSDLKQIRSEGDVVQIRQEVRKWALAIGLGLVDQTKIITAASELARNALEYGGGGTALFEQLEQGTRRGLRLTFTDEGPGISDIDRALSDGYTTGGGMGLGLGGAKRLVNEFEITSSVGQGTTVTITRWK